MVRTNIAMLFACACAAATVVVACGSTSRGFGTGAPDAGVIEDDGGLTGKRCSAAGTICVGNAVHACSGGEPGALQVSCDAEGAFCIDGACAKGCEAAIGQPSNVGCEFWAVDLDNSFSALDDAANQNWGVFLSNFGDGAATVVIEQNDAPFGAPPQIKLVKTVQVPAGGVAEVVLPTREVDGTTNAKNNGTGTALSSNAYRLRSNLPVIAYQVNAFNPSYSTDASMLMPTSGLGQVYRVLGWPPSIPIAILPVDGIPDHSYVTIVGTAAATEVEVTLAGPILGAPTVRAGVKGDTLKFQVGPFDVVNLESTGIPGDLTGTAVTSNKPIVVFTGAERASAPNPRPANFPTPPGFGTGTTCCTDHIEEQLFPVESLGKSFVISRTPIRSSGFVEADSLRFMAVAEPTSFKTNLAAPFDQFTLQPGQFKDAFTTTDAVVESSAPAMVAQMIASSDLTNSSQLLGDPSLTIFPPVDQYRTDYLFNVLKGWTTDYVVVAQPVGAAIVLDGKPLAAANCVSANAGALGAQSYEVKTCPMQSGAHRISGDKPFGIMSYGYVRRGSYAFPGGANVRKIYVPPPLK